LERGIHGKVTCEDGTARLRWRSTRVGNPATLRS
jgi:hypothetical protein